MNTSIVRTRPHTVSSQRLPFAGLEIRATNLTKRYGANEVVRNLSFTVRPGIVTGFLGPNGAGKSTTLRMLLGLAAPTSGSITIGGRPIAALRAPARSIGALLDAQAVHPHRTGANHLLAFAQAAGLGKERVAEVLDLVGLTDAAGRHTGEFSLGMKQRLGIASALLGDPSVLVFDEPLNGLDPEGIRWLRRLMSDLSREGRTILFSSHLMSEMELTADDLIVIGRGQLIAESPLEQFVRAHTTQAVTVSSPAKTQLARALARALVPFTDVGGALLATDVDPATVGRIAAAESIPLDELGWVRDSLEDVFLRLTAGTTDYEGHNA